MQNAIEMHPDALARMDMLAAFHQRSGVLGNGSHRVGKEAQSSSLPNTLKSQANGSSPATS